MNNKQSSFSGKYLPRGQILSRFKNHPATDLQALPYIVRFNVMHPVNHTIVVMKKTVCRKMV